VAAGSPAGAARSPRAPPRGLIRTAHDSFENIENRQPATDSVAAELHDLRQLAATVDALEQEIAQKASRLAAVEGELSDLRREVEWTEQLHAKQQLRLGELEAQLDRSLARQRQLDVEARDLRERAARSDELARGLADRNARLGALREDLTRQMMRISRLETELAERGIIARQLEAELARARGLSRPAIRPEPRPVPRPVPRATPPPVARPAPEPMARPVEIRHRQVRSAPAAVAARTIPQRSPRVPASTAASSGPLQAGGGWLDRAMPEFLTGVEKQHGQPSDEPA